MRSPKDDKPKKGSAKKSLRDPLKDWAYEDGGDFEELVEKCWFCGGTGSVEYPSGNSWCPRCFGSGFIYKPKN